MKRIRSIIILASLALVSLSSMAQVESASGGVRRRTAKDKKTEQTGPQVTDRMQSFYEAKETSDADLVYMREIYRQIDLSKDVNAPLYFPEDIIDGQENLFRIMLRLVVDGQVPAYEYLDGREVFSDKYKIDPKEMLDRFGIYYTGNDKKITIEEADVPSNMVLNYYIIEKWEFDKRSNKMKSRVVAICPILNRFDDYGAELRYPMFWIKYDQLRPHLAATYVFTSDDNNLPQYSLDDYFTMGLYDGDIYKTKNLRNLSMMQMYPDPDEMKAAQDSIDKRLRNFGANLWMPTREEYLAMLEAMDAEEDAPEAAPASAENEESMVPNRDGADTENSVTLPAATPKTSARASRTTNKKTTTSNNNKKKKAAKPKYSSSSSGSDGVNVNADKSVRRRKK